MHYFSFVFLCAHFNLASATGWRCRLKWAAKKSKLKLSSSWIQSFSANPKDYEYPSSGMIYGQSYLCLSLTAKQIDVVGKQLIYNEPQIYDFSLPSNLETIYPNFEDLIQEKNIKKGPFSSDVELTTIDGVTFRSFAKSRKFEKELYEDWVNFLNQCKKEKSIYIRYSLVRLHPHWTQIFMLRHGAEAKIFHQAAQKRPSKKNSFLSVIAIYFNQKTVFLFIAFGMCQKSNSIEPFTSKALAITRNGLSAIRILSGCAWVT